MIRENRLSVAMPTPINTFLLVAWLATWVSVEHSAPVGAHDTLTAVLEQRVACVLHPEAIDFEFVWNFHGDLARAERLAMDTDGDGSISPREERTYAEALLDKSELQLGLTVSGGHVDLVSYYDPDVLLGNDHQVSRKPLTLKLFCFARWPEKSLREVRLVVEDRLWSHLPALVETGVGRSTSKTRDQLLAIDLVDQALRSIPAGAPRIFRFQTSAPSTLLHAPAPPGALPKNRTTEPQPTSETKGRREESWVAALWAPALLFGLLFLLSRKS
jgi:hypothetical protein